MSNTNAYPIGDEPLKWMRVYMCVCGLIAHVVCEAVGFVFVSRGCFENFISFFLCTLKVNINSFCAFIFIFDQWKNSTTIRNKVMLSI